MSERQINQCHFKGIFSLKPEVPSDDPLIPVKLCTADCKFIVLFLKVLFVILSFCFWIKETF